MLPFLVIDGGEEALDKPFMSKLKGPSVKLKEVTAEVSICLTLYVLHWNKTSYLGLILLAGAGKSGNSSALVFQCDVVKSQCHLHHPPVITIFDHFYRCYKFMALFYNQWPFQEPMDWRYLPYIRPNFHGYGSGDISPVSMAKNMVRLRPF